MQLLRNKKIYIELLYGFTKFLFLRNTFQSKGNDCKATVNILKFLSNTYKVNQVQTAKLLDKISNQGLILPCEKTL